MDFIEAKLKKFELAIERLPKRISISEYWSRPEENGLFNKEPAKILLNEFMGYIIQVDGLNDKEFTPEQIEYIIEIDGLFQTYFEDNLIVAKTHQADNQNAQTDEQKEEELKDHVMHVSGNSSDPHYSANSYNAYVTVRTGVSNSKPYLQIFDLLLKMDIDIFTNSLTDEERNKIREIAKRQSWRDNLRPSYPGVSITLPKPPSPKKP